MISESQKWWKWNTTIFNIILLILWIGGRASPRFGQKAPQGSQFQTIKEEEEEEEEEEDEEEEEEEEEGGGGGGG